MVILYIFTDSNNQKKRLLRPPSARVIKPSNQNQGIEIPYQIQRGYSISNNKSYFISNENAYVGRSIMKNRKTAFGSISNK